MPPQHNNAAFLVLLIVDGVGLAIIAGCTILEGMDLWKDFFNEYYDSNFPMLSFWFSGRFCQLIGLVLLISFAASFQIFPELERCGMLMLTVGPVLNLCGYSLFQSELDPFSLYNKRWTASELLELIGILVLDVSMIEALEEYIVLTAEIIGFAILACAAMLEFEFTVSTFIPIVDVRLDMVHGSDCFGLGLLTMVAIGQYKMKISEQHDKQHH